MRIIGKVLTGTLKQVVIKAADAFSRVGNETVVTSAIVDGVEHVVTLEREEYIMRRTRQRYKPTRIDNFIHCAF